MDASRLESLLESARLLHASLDLEQLLSHLLRTVMGRLLVRKAVIAVAEKQGFRVSAVRGLSQVRLGDRLDRGTAREAGVARFLPIGPSDAPAGLFGIGEAFRPIEAADEEFLEALLGIAASGISNARAHAQARTLNEELNQKVQDLRSLLELVQSLTSMLEPSEIAHVLVLTLTGRWGVGRYALGAWKEGHPPLLLNRGIDLPDLETLQQEARTIQAPTPVSDLADGALKAKLEAGSGSAVFPLISAQGVFGLVALGPRIQKLPFSRSDLEFGGGLTAQAAVAFENSWHFHETVEKRKIEQEVELAAGIQKDLFPKQLPRMKGLDLAAASLAARQVGGDYYDFLSLDGDAEDRPRLICVADVSGKGIPASLLMSNIQATLRALLSPELPLVELITRTSQLLYATTPSNKYATAILALVDPVSGEVSYVNAGHNDALLLKSGGEVVRLASTGPPLGLLPGMPFGQGQVLLQPGDLLTLFSDGVVEAQNADGGEFEEERFLACLRSCDGVDSEGVIQAAFEAIERFVGDAPQHDDITLLVIRGLPSS